MLLMIMCSLTLTVMFSMILMPSPVTLGTIILLSAFMICTSISLMSFSWAGMIIFLIYIGGMLVMFAYFAAIQPNQHLTKATPLTLLLIPLPIIMMSLLMNHTTPSTSKSDLLYSSSLSPLYFWSNIPILMFLGLILFLALVSVVKVSKSTLGPLRPFNYV